jgi:hypothetical protein
MLLAIAVLLFSLQSNHNQKYQAHTKPQAAMPAIPGSALMSSVVYKNHRFSPCSSPVMAALENRWQ